MPAMPATTLFSNPHLARSHHLQHPTQAPPSSFGNTGSRAFKTSLRKIPSALFTRSDAAKDRATPPLSYQPPVLPTGYEKNGKPKIKTRTRKALGELFGFGNSSLAVASSASHVPAPQAAPLPPLKESMQLKKAPPHRDSARSTSATCNLSGSTSLRPPHEPIARASIGDDPFGRKGEAAEVVEHVTRHGVAPSLSSAGADARGSIASSTALSTKTVESERAGTKEIRQSCMPQAAASRTRDNRLAREGSAPYHGTSSISPAAGTRPSLGVHVNPVAPWETFQPAPPPSAFPKPAERGLHREKTKSKVWEFLAGGEKIVKPKHQSKGDTAQVERPRAPLEDEEPYIKINFTRVSKESQRLNVPASDDPFNVPGTTQPPSALSIHPCPPVLHISKPSSDAGHHVSRFGGSTASAAESSMQIPPQGFRPDVAFDSLPASPPKAASTARQERPWQGVVGSVAGSAPSLEGPKQAAAAMMGSKAVPKRKSLTGLFGISLRRSSDKLRAASSSTTRSSVSPPRAIRCRPEPRLKSLAEEMGDRSMAKEAGKSKLSPSVADRSLRRVASATDRLLKLVTHFDLTPNATPSDGRSPTLMPKASLQSLKASPTPVGRFKYAMLSAKPSASPIKTSTVSPLKLALHRAHLAKKPSQNAFDRSCTPSSHSEVALSHSKSSLVKKGMRNIFAPASPPVITPIPTKPAAQQAKQAKVDVQPSGGAAQSTPPRAEEGDSSFIKDIPDDLQAIIQADDSPEFDSSVTARLGLPPLPPKDRVTPRRNARAAPAVSPPPLPDLPFVTPGERGTKQLVPQISLEVKAEHPARDPMFGDFDFTSEWAALDHGQQRASFVEAVQAVGGQTLFEGVQLATKTIYARASQPLVTIEQSPDSKYAWQELVEEEGVYSDAEEPVDMPPIVRSSPRQIEGLRREPFRGQIAFQQGISKMLEETQSIEVISSAQFLEEPAPSRRRGHRRDESGVSIATMSSIGDVIETGIAGEYTNYFDANFAQHLGDQRRNSVDEVSMILDVPTDALSPSSHSHSDSIDSISDMLHSRRSQTRRAHHRRNSSILSVESIGLTSSTMGAGPPVSMHNAKRSSYVSRHRRSGSFDSAWGRADWAAHKRKSSTDSAVSMISVSRIVRPGLGDRMFQLDGGVQLAPITASPPDHDAIQRPHHGRADSFDSLSDWNVGHGAYGSIVSPIYDRADQSYDSILDPTHERAQQAENWYDSILGPTPERVNYSFDSNLNPGGTRCDSGFDRPEEHARCSSISSNSFFDASSREGDADADADLEEAVVKRGFFLRGVRPASDVSMSSSGEAQDDTFINVVRYAQRMAKRSEECLHGEGEDQSTLTRSQAPSMADSTGKQLLNESLSRPAKPRAVHRRRPPTLKLIDRTPTTPGLTSPSTSDLSSRLSLDTNCSDMAFGRPGGGARPTQAGHHPQKSSAVVNVEATIREEPSMATLRPKQGSTGPANLPHQASPSVPQEPNIVAWDEAPPSNAVTTWLQFQRVAEAVCQRTKSFYRDSDESRHATDTFKAPTSSAEIAAFLANSSEAYKPLDELPIGRIAHRRKSSLSDSRASLSPYGLPLPRGGAEVKKKKGSLETKFERSNSASSADFVMTKDASTRSAPPSSIFAPFHQVVASPLTEVPSTTQKQQTISALAPFQIPSFDAFGLQEQAKGDTPSLRSNTYGSARTRGKIPVFATTISAVDAKPEAASEPGFNPRTAGSTTSQATLAPPREPLSRIRVDSNERRANLGWSRRRNSDDPAKVVAASATNEPAARLPLAPKTATATTFAAASAGRSFGSAALRQENGTAKMSSRSGAMRPKPHNRGVHPSSSQVRALRA